MPSVAITGTRGYPSHYGGLETAVRHIAPYLASHGWDVTVHSRKGLAVDSADAADPRVQVFPVPAIEKRALSNLSSGLASTLVLLKSPPDVALVMSTGSGFWLPLLRLRHIPTVVNTDGLEWKRDKWGRLAKRVLYSAAWMTARYADRLVFDARAIQNYWRREFRRNGTFIPYGGDAAPDAVELPDGITPGNYVLMVARFVPENSVGPFLQAVPTIASKIPVVLVGASGWSGDDPLDAEADVLANQLPDVYWLRHIKDTKLLNALYANATLYFHGHTVGGTNPSLVQAMTAGSAVVAIDTVYNREVLGPDAPFVKPAEIAPTILQLLDSPAELARLGEANHERAATQYTWDAVNRGYEAVLRGAIASGRRSSR